MPQCPQIQSPGIIFPDSRGVIDVGVGAPLFSAKVADSDAEAAPPGDGVVVPAIAIGIGTGRMTGPGIIRGCAKEMSVAAGRHII